MKSPARGGFALGLIIGLLLGLGLALGVALYITKVPIPFVDKLPQRTAEQDAAEAERNRNWDPNAPLAGKSAQTPVAAAASAAPVAAAAPAASAAAPAGRDPAAILAGAPVTAPAQAVAAKPAASSVPTVPARSTTVAGDPFVYFIQVGAYTNADEAEQQRAKLALAGWSAKITEREQSGRTVFRVRLPVGTAPALAPDADGGSA